MQEASERAHREVGSSSAAPMQPFGEKMPHPMKPLRFGFVLMAIGLSGCTPLSQSPATAVRAVRMQAVDGGPQWLSEHSARSEPAPPAWVDHEVGVDWKNCDDFLGALRGGKVPEAATEMPPFNAYVDCLPPALMARGRARVEGGLDPIDAGERIYRDLDLVTVPSSLAPRRPAEHYRLQDFSFRSVRVGPLTLDLRDDAFGYKFQVLAIGDFRRSGRNELLVQFDDVALNGGSYRRRAVLVIDAPPGIGTALEAANALDLLRAQVPLEAVP